MAVYFTMETVRDQLLEIGSVDSVSVSGKFPSDWQYCPCTILQKCEERDIKYCQVKIGISFRNPNLGLLILEIIYSRENRTGVVRTNHVKLNELLNRNTLETVVI